MIYPTPVVNTFREVLELCLRQCGTLTQYRQPNLLLFWSLIDPLSGSSYTDQASYGHALQYVLSNCNPPEVGECVASEAYLTTMLGYHHRLRETVDSITGRISDDEYYCDLLPALLTLGRARFEAVFENPTLLTRDTIKTLLLIGGVFTSTFCALQSERVQEPRPYLLTENIRAAMNTFSESD
jgi:hypothetical protein